MHPIVSAWLLLSTGCRSTQPVPVDSGDPCSPAPEIPYDGLDQDCDGFDLTDVDRDGHEHPGDCDDSDPSVYPGQTEIPYDDIDQDCDGADLVDADGDGFPLDVDCDDNDSYAYPGAYEFCDGADQDCDGTVDNDPLDGQWFLFDADEDGFAGTEIWACQGWGYTTLDDCDDQSPLVNPSASEACGNHTDDNCDGLVDTMRAGSTHTSIQQALDAMCSPGDEVWIAEGTWTETVSILRPVTLRGSGASTTIDGSTCSGECTVITVAESATGTELREFGITGGEATAGGALYIGASDVVLEQLDIFGNTADKGGGIATNLAENLLVHDCTFRENYAGLGAAIYLGIGSPSLANTELSGNTFSDNTGLYSISGALYLNHLADSGSTGLSIDSNTFDSNSTGSIHAARGAWMLTGNTFSNDTGLGALICSGGVLHQTGNSFSGNSADYYPNSDECTP